MPVEDEDDWAEGSEKILTKYNDDVQIAQDKKKQQRIKIGIQQAPVHSEIQAKTDNLETIKTFGSDYFTENEVGLRFKKKTLLVGKKRRHQEDDTADIVA